MKKKMKMLSKCCVCKKFKRKEGFIYSDRAHMDEWGHHIEDLVHMQDHYDIIFSHGYCPACAKIAMKELDTLKPIQLA